MKHILETHNVSKSFGELKAVKDCSIEIPENSIIGLIGLNGAGKTTLFNIITGFLKPDSGEVRFMGKSITNEPPHKLALLGLVRTFQTPFGFPEMTVMENLMVATPEQPGEIWWKGLMASKEVTEVEKEVERKALAQIERLGLKNREHELVKNLSPGEARLLEVARQLMLYPKVLLLDEPASGLSPDAQVLLGEVLKNLKKDGVTLFVIEHNLGFVTKISDEILVMSRGEIFAQGPPDTIFENEKVKNIYLGGM